MSLSDTPPCDISIHAPRMGSDTASQDTGRARQDFNPRSPDGERRAPPRRHSRTGGYFNPRSPDGERLAIWSRIDCNTDISIHAPRMGSDGHQHVLRNHHHHISIHAPRMGSDHLPSCGVLAQVGISIHAPRMGSDARAPRCGIAAEFISIHAPRMGSDWVVSSMPWMGPVFQSTLPGWGATRRLPDASRPATYFNPRSPDGERPSCARGCRASWYFNPRSPDGERRVTLSRVIGVSNFNPRSPDGERPEAHRRERHLRRISIHAPRMGSDL